MKVRIIIGPNGSGKTTFYHSLSNEFKLNMGLFINADIIEYHLKKNGSYVCKDLFNEQSEQELKLFLKNTTYNQKYDLSKSAKTVRVNDGTLFIKKNLINSYLTGAIAEFLRNKAIENKMNFSFESVFSDKSKVDLVKDLASFKYKIYLYVIATINPAINIKRVQERVKHKGHDVDEEKIVSRFHKSLTNIKKVIPKAHRVFIIDNSQENNPEIIVELEKNKIQFLHSTYQPNWVLNLLK